MSADNWAVCPKCKAHIDKEREKLLAKIESSYGKIKPEEYLRLVEKSKQPITYAQTLREYYELGILISDGDFYVSYGCGCEECSFNFSYKHSEKIQIT